MEEGDEVILFSPFYGYHTNVLRMPARDRRSRCAAPLAFDRDELRARSPQIKASWITRRATRAAGLHA